MSTGIRLGSRIAVVVFLPAVVALAYYYPRMLVARLGLDSPWTNFFYHYGFGFVAFMTGLWLILGSGACRPGRGRDGLWLLVLIGGFLLYLVVHTVWTLGALRVPFLGGAS